MIKGIQLHKKFNELNVLNGIDISIAEREIVSIVGKSGAGKTTLLQILGTLERPSSGKVLYDEKNVFDLNANELARELIIVLLIINSHFLASNSKDITE